MRKARAKKHVLLPDPKFNDVLVTRFVNNMMLQGKKAKAKAQERGLDVWKKALNNVMPSVEVKSRRVGGATFQIPMEVPADRKVAVGMKWLIKYSRNRGEKTMADKLANEILAASKNEGSSVKKREDTHKMADANKAFSHFKIS
jgi:small subunit ribosomal protein S7